MGDWGSPVNFDRPARRIPRSTCTPVYSWMSATASTSTSNWCVTNISTKTRLPTRSRLQRFITTATFIEDISLKVSYTTTSTPATAQLLLRRRLQPYVRIDRARLRPECRTHHVRGRRDRARGLHRLGRSGHVPARRVLRQPRVYATTAPDGQRRTVADDRFVLTISYEHEAADMKKGAARRLFICRRRSRPNAAQFQLNTTLPDLPDSSFEAFLGSLRSAVGGSAPCRVETPTNQLRHLVPGLVHAPAVDAVQGSRLEDDLVSRCRRQARD